MTKDGKKATWAQPYPQLTTPTKSKEPPRSLTSGPPESPCEEQISFLVSFSLCLCSPVICTGLFGWKTWIFHAFHSLWINSFPLSSVSSSWWMSKRRDPPDRSPCQALKRRPCCWRSGCLSRRPLAGCTEPSSALSSQPGIFSGFQQFFNLQTQSISELFGWLWQTSWPTPCPTNRHPNCFHEVTRWLSLGMTDRNYEVRTVLHSWNVLTWSLPLLQKELPWAH